MPVRARSGPGITNSIRRSDPRNCRPQPNKHSLIKPKSKIRTVILSSSLLTERLLLYSSLLPALEDQAQTSIWTTSERNLDFGGANGIAPIAIEPFPAIRPFKEFPFNYLRRLNEFAWDDKLRPPSRTGIVQRFRDRETRLPIRALKLPARVLSLLRMENRLETWLEGVLLDYPRSPEGARRLQATVPD